MRGSQSWLPPAFSRRLEFVHFQAPQRPTGSAGGLCRRCLVGQDGILRTDCQSVLRRLSAGACRGARVATRTKEPPERRQAGYHLSRWQNKSRILNSCCTTSSKEKECT